MDELTQEQVEEWALCILGVESPGCTQCTHRCASEDFDMALAAAVLTLLAAKRGGKAA